MDNRTAARVRCASSLTEIAGHADNRNAAASDGALESPLERVGEDGPGLLRRGCLPVAAVLGGETAAAAAAASSSQHRQRVVITQLPGRLELGQVSYESNRSVSCIASSSKRAPATHR